MDSSHCSLSSKQRHWLTLSKSTIFSSEVFFGTPGFEPGASGQVCLTLCFAVPLPSLFSFVTLQQLREKKDSEGNVQKNFSNQELLKTKLPWKFFRQKFKIWNFWDISGSRKKSYLRLSNFFPIASKMRKSSFGCWMLDSTDADRGSDAAGKPRSSWRRFNKSYTACKLRFYCCQWSHTSNVFLKVMFNR